MSELDDLQRLLLWAREQRIVLSSVQLGTLSVIVERDHGMKLPSQGLTAAERRPSIYEQYAGKLLESDVPVAQTNEPTVEDEE